MLDLVLPSSEETTINVTIGDKKISMDIIDIESLTSDAWAELDRLGIEDTKKVFSIWSELFHKSYGVKLSPFQVNALWNAADRMRDEIKKKYFQKSEQPSSTEPSESQPPVEN